VHKVLFLGQYLKNANFSGTKLILNSNLQTLMAAKYLDLQYFGDGNKLIIAMVLTHSKQCNEKKLQPYGMFRQWTVCSTDHTSKQSIKLIWWTRILHCSWHSYLTAYWLRSLHLWLTYVIQTEYFSTATWARRRYCYCHFHLFLSHSASCTQERNSGPKSGVMSEFWTCSTVSLLV